MRKLNELVNIALKDMTEEEKELIKNEIEKEYDNIEKEEFLNEFGLRDVDEEWLKIREFCEQQNLTFEEIKERLERNE